MIDYPHFRDIGCDSTNTDFRTILQRYQVHCQTHVVWVALFFEHRKESTKKNAMFTALKRAKESSCIARIFGPNKT